MGGAIGDVVAARNPVTSKVEETIRTALVEAGFVVPKTKRAIVCRHPDSGNRTLLLTPDVLLAEERIAIEVDPCAPRTHHSRAYTHLGEEEKDRVRNRLYEDAGWSVIRLRLSASEGQHIGDRDVVCASDGATVSAKAALVDAIRDHVSGAPSRVRIVAKSASPSKAQRRSHVTNIGPNQYTDDGYYFSWFASLENPVKVIMRLCDGGRYLYSHGETRYIATVRLDQQPREEWKRLIESAMRAASGLSGTTKWPWGERLFVADSDDGEEIAKRFEYKGSIDDAGHSFTVNCDRLARWDRTYVATAGDEPIAWLHPSAIEAGYRIYEVQAHQGRHGPYQRIFVLRHGEELADLPSQ